jgi:hypothetical protein
VVVLRPHSRETPSPISAIKDRTDVAEVTGMWGRTARFLGDAGTEIQTAYFEHGCHEIANRKGR